MCCRSAWPRASGRVRVMRGRGLAACGVLYARARATSACAKLCVRPRADGRGPARARAGAVGRAQRNALRAYLLLQGRLLLGTLLDALFASGLCSTSSFVALNSTCGRPGAMCARAARTCSSALEPSALSTPQSLGSFCERRSTRGIRQARCRQTTTCEGATLVSLRLSEPFLIDALLLRPRVVFSRDGVREGERRVARAHAHARARASLTDSRRPRRTDRG